MTTAAHFLFPTECVVLGEEFGQGSEGVAYDGFVNLQYDGTPSSSPMVTRDGTATGADATSGSLQPWIRRALSRLQGMNISESDVMKRFTAAAALPSHTPACEDEPVAQGVVPPPVPPPHCLAAASPLAQTSFGKSLLSSMQGSLPSAASIQHSDDEPDAQPEPAGQGQR